MKADYRNRYNLPHAKLNRDQISQAAKDRRANKVIDPDVNEECTRTIDWLFENKHGYRR